MATTNKVRGYTVDTWGTGGFYDMYTVPFFGLFRGFLCRKQNINYLRPLESPVMNMAEAEVSGKVSGLVKMLLQSPDSNCRTDKL